MKYMSRRVMLRAACWPQSKQRAKFTVRTVSSQPFEKAARYCEQTLRTANFKLAALISQVNKTYQKSAKSQHRPLNADMLNSGLDHPGRW
jgi:hypothetical protein